MSASNEGTPKAPPPRFSRARIETVCLLSVIPAAGCTPAALVIALGLSEAHAVLVPRLVDGLDEHVTTSEGRVLLTPAGNAYLSKALLALEAAP